jgi:hypothetical protein
MEEGNTRGKKGEEELDAWTDEHAGSRTPASGVGLLPFSLRTSER